MRPAELGGHPVPGLHGEDLGPALAQEPGGDAGPGSHVGHPGPGERPPGEGLDGIEEGRG